MSARPGVALPLALVAVTVLALAAMGVAWRARLAVAAEGGASSRQAQWWLADSLGREASCPHAGSLGSQTSERWRSADGRAVLRTTHRWRDACWVTLAVDDTLPQVGILLRPADSTITPMADVSRSGLPTIEGVPRIPLARNIRNGRFAPRRLPGPSWVQLR
ncbi:MAG: hypothetical protein SFW08_00395 [Gemmatimonadaceae bacterium]|nr:hypothetical protein [Gemmatimonadaceae bacterium]